ncbi:hypothetical protein [Flavobacterium cerinum]|uniref:Uncharacterized protein n=1 Tax=Flavobacterium cerinum TaxID=2502784 RepID=A0ABY5IQN4_9FLAO|nr:hypothetical protein [Flavobacterium cerinum]UUC45128.1 hypothetical protein NOX80_16075 [Flavobacterium cerinum]
MEEIKNFITAFIQDEFTCNKANYDFSISDEEYEKMRLKVTAYFHTVNADEYWRGLEGEDVQELDHTMKEVYFQNVKSAIPRSLFQIKQYKNPKVGEGLARWLTSDALFACYTSYTETNDLPLDYSTVFYVASTNEGFKIIYKIRYESDVPEWRHSHNLKINQVANPGKFIAVEKYQAPQEVNSLADYNAG